MHDVQAARGTPLTGDGSPDGFARDTTTSGARPRLLMAAVALVAYVLDVGTKIWAVEHLTGREPLNVVGDLLRFNLTRNPGAAFSTGTGLTLALSSLAVVAVVVCGVPAAMQQQRYSPILKHAHQHTRIDWPRLGIVITMLVVAIVVNVLINSRFHEHSERFPWLGAAVWLVILASTGVRRPDWELMPEAFKGSVFLLALVLCASMMPVDRLPAASWQTAFGLGFLAHRLRLPPLVELQYWKYMAALFAGYLVVISIFFIVKTVVLGGRGSASHDHGHGH